VLGTAVLIALVSIRPQTTISAEPQPDNQQIDLLIEKHTGHRAPDGLTMRVRLQAITLAEASEIQWRYGGEGQGGEVIRGTFSKSNDSEQGSKRLDIGEWSAPVAATSLVEGAFPGKFFLTVTAGRPGRTADRISRRRIDFSTDAVFEFEFSCGGKVIKRFTERGPQGGTVTLVIPACRLTGDIHPDDPAFTGSWAVCWRMPRRELRSWRVCRGLPGRCRESTC
jgi:hypothetical protein